MFGEMLGLWCVQVWHDQGRPKNPAGGAGSGTRHPDGRCLCAPPRLRRNFWQGWRWCWSRPARCCNKSSGRKIEETAARRSAGRRISKTAWRPAALPVANEFFDALPLRQYVKTERGWCERMVMAKEGSAGFRAGADRRRPPPPFRRIAPAAPKAGFMKPRLPAPRWRKKSRASSRPEAAARCCWIMAMATDGDGFGETLQAVGGHRIRRCAGRSRRK